MSSASSFVKIAWKVALVLVALRFAGAIAARSSPIKFDALLSQQKNQARLKKEVEEAKAKVARLAAQLASERSRGSEIAEIMRQEVAFWRQMEGLARKGVVENIEMMMEVERQLALQKKDTQDLHARLHDTEIRAAQESALVQEHDSLQASLTSRTSALDDVSAQNAASDDDVLHVVRALNTKIVQTARAMSSAFRIGDAQDPGVVTAAYERVREAVGPVMADFLDFYEHQEDPFLVNIALEASMTGFVAEIISTWDFRHQNTSVFTGIYKEMLKSEPLTIAARWRSLTRRYSKQNLYTGRDLTSGFAHQVAERLSNILILAGANATPQQIHESYELETIIRLALDLQRIIGEDAISCNLETFIARADDPFDPEHMERAEYMSNGSESPNPVTHVLCSTELGLRRWEKLREDVEELQSTTLLKPHVVLDTLVDALQPEDEEGH
ncbi:hypothetical protein A0H81_07693 [Grifola frondosa]|uniref:MICOS complex subunit MIC60 n=1 Tax=Grifola frondosa TaxID=5627 RepID=A0A1C7M675_GRIFR|nr:hypothetical protein A0H81_07693 [Grifola frondosa]